MKLAYLSSTSLALVGALLGLHGRATAQQELFKLLPSDGATGDRFGHAVSASEGRAVVGAHYDDDNGSNSGSVYVFDVTTGQQLLKLLASDGAANDQFGVSVCVRGSRAVVGAHYDDDNGSASGSAYVFDVTTGQQLLKLLPSDGAVADLFGSSVASDGDRAVVGACHDDDLGTSSGSAYVFDLTTGQQLFKLLPADGLAEDCFGGVCPFEAIVQSSGLTVTMTTERTRVPPTSST